MTPRWPDRLLDEIDGIDRHANQIARGLTSAQLNWRPSPESWSVGQCLDHLLVTNKVYLPPIATALENRTPSAVDEITPGWFGRWFIRTAIDPATQKRRGRAPKKSTPAQQVDADILERFLQSNIGLRELIRRAAPCNVNRIRFHNPFVPVIWFTVGTGFEIVVRHQRRHLLQAERIRNSREFPKSEAGSPGLTSNSSLPAAP